MERKERTRQKDKVMAMWGRRRIKKNPNRTNRVYHSPSAAFFSLTHTSANLYKKLALPGSPLSRALSPFELIITSSTSSTSPARASSMMAPLRRRVRDNETNQSRVNETEINQSRERKRRHDNERNQSQGAAA